MKRCINFTQLAVLLSLLFTVGNGIAETQDENIKGRINFDFSDVSEAIIEVNVSSKLFTLLTKSCGARAGNWQISGNDQRGIRSGIREWRES